MPEKQAQAQTSDTFVGCRALKTLGHETPIGQRELLYKSPSNTLISASPHSLSQSLSLNPPQTLASSSLAFQSMEFWGKQLLFHSLTSSYSIIIILVLVLGFFSSSSYTIVNHGISLSHSLFPRDLFYFILNQIAIFILLVCLFFLCVYPQRRVCMYDICVCVCLIFIKMEELFFFFFSAF